MSRPASQLQEDARDPLIGPRPRPARPDADAVANSTHPLADSLPSSRGVAQNSGADSSVSAAAPKASLGLDLDPDIENIQPRPIPPNTDLAAPDTGLPTTTTTIASPALAPRESEPQPEPPEVEPDPNLNAQQQEQPALVTDHRHDADHSLPFSLPLPPPLPPPQSRRLSLPVGISSTPTSFPPAESLRRIASLSTLPTNTHTLESAPTIYPPHTTADTPTPDPTSQKDPSIAKPPPSRLPFGPSFGATAVLDGGLYAPQQLPSTPSHAYDLYSQNVDIRPISERAFPLGTTTEEGQTGPTHPYRMYPQNVISHPIEGDNAASVQATIPIGFPGRIQHYQRVIGADGEEQGIIGAEGHAEPLPPYSRYPPNSSRLAASPQSEVTDQPRPSDEDGTSERQNQTNTISSQEHTLNPSEAPTPGTVTDSGSRPSSDRTPDGNSSRTASNGTTTVPTERDGPGSAESSSAGSDSTALAKPKPWPRERHFSVYGYKVRLGYALIIIFLIILATVLGVTLGITISNEKKQASAYGNEEENQGYDKVPTTVAAMPTGIFSMEGGTVDFEQSNCIDSAYASAWSCEYNGPEVAVEVTRMPSKPVLTGVTIFSGFEEPVPLRYGTQPMNIEASRLVLTMDSDQPTMGPAYHFFSFYDKVVVLPEASLDNVLREKTTNRHRRRHDLRSRVIRDGSGSKDVEAGARVWVCFWNSTFVEGFFYADEWSERYSRSMESRRSNSAVSTSSSSSTGADKRAEPTADHTSCSPTPTQYDHSFSDEHARPAKRTAPTARTDWETESEFFGKVPRSQPTAKPFPKAARLEERRVWLEDNGVPIAASGYSAPPFCQLAVARSANNGTGSSDSDGQAPTAWESLPDVRPVLDKDGKGVIVKLDELTPETAPPDSDGSFSIDNSFDYYDDNRDEDDNGVADGDDSYLSVGTVEAELYASRSGPVQRGAGVRQPPWRARPTKRTPPSAAAVAVAAATATARAPLPPAWPTGYRRRKRNEWAENTCQCQRKIF